MEQEYDFIAPTGEELQGTSESVLAAAGCHFTGPNPDEDFDHSGGSEVFWDTMTTETIAGAALFTDRSGMDWPAHQLIPANADPLEAVTVELMHRENRLGRALDAARDFKQRMDALDVAVLALYDQDIETIIRSLESHHGAAKTVALAARAADLKAQEPRPMADAPTDGTLIVGILSSGRRVIMCYWANWPGWRQMHPADAPNRQAYAVGGEPVESIDLIGWRPYPAPIPVAA